MPQEVAGAQVTPAEEKARAELARLKGERSGVGRRILAIDPGTAATGICLLVDGKPEWIRVIREKGASADDRLPAMCCAVSSLVTEQLRYNDVDTVAVEDQMIRPSDKRPNDILQLAKVVGAVFAGIPHPIEPFLKLYSPLPVQWKGSVPEDVFGTRILKLFPDAGQLMHGVPPSLQHNGFDALGLALWAIRKALPWQT